jgi:hypothetical protein
MSITNKKIEMLKKIFILLFLIATSNAISQVPGEPIGEFDPDSVIIFEPARPLVTMEEMQGAIKNAWGLDLLISDEGFAFGLFYIRDFSNSLSGFANFYFSNARNTDEFEFWDPYYREYRITNKINRLYKIPISIGFIQYLFRNSLSESLQPYITGGISPTLIISNPYTAGRVPNGEKVGWFSSWNESQTYFRFGGFLGIGAYFGAMNNGLIGVHAKYYYTPFGGDGLESVFGSPLDNFGGFFLGLSIGKKY